MESRAHGRGRRRPRPFFLGGLTATLGLFIVVLPLACTQSWNQDRFMGVAPGGTPAVRVLLLENRQSVELSATDPPNIRIGSGTARQIALSGGTAVPVTLTAAGWKVGSAMLGVGEMTVEPSPEGSVRIDKRAYRGRYRFLSSGGGRFNVINDLDVDGYVMSVVPREMYSNWHVEAYRAQAIVARTYALYVSRTSPANASYDLFADTRSQVYGGIVDETPKSRYAVDSTRGIVVAHGPSGQERIFKAYFSSCCGGTTQSAADAFGDPPSEPLSEQQIGPRCVESKYFNWPPVAIRKAELTRRMRLWGAANNAPERTIGDISRIDIESANRFGRPRAFVISDTRGYRYSLNSEDFRHAANFAATDGVTLGSSFCKPINDPTSVRFTDGHGLGHGVGLCQYCAEHEATAGVLYDAIVRDAFPHAKLIRAY